MAHSKHEVVRQRYKFRCGYCGVSEVDAGGELTVDHFWPVSAGGDDSDDNLVYACMRCNLYKGDYAPNEADSAIGRRVLHPAHDDVGVHITEERASGILRAISETGSFHISLLRLNRPELIEHRVRRYLAELTEQKLNALSQENATLREALVVRRRFLRRTDAD